MSTTPRTRAALSLAADGRWTGDRESLRRQLAIVEAEAAAPDAGLRETTCEHEWPVISPCPECGLDAVAARPAAPDAGLREALERVLDFADVGDLLTSRDGLQSRIDARAALAAHPAPAGPAVEGNQDAGGIPRGPWDDR